MQVFNMSHMRNQLFKMNARFCKKLKNDKAPGCPQRKTSGIINESLFSNFRNFLGGTA